jgi:hypothetical protein
MLHMTARREEFAKAFQGMSRRTSRTYGRAKHVSPTRCHCDTRFAPFLGSAKLGAITLTLTLTLQVQVQVTLAEADNVGSGGTMTAHHTKGKLQGDSRNAACHTYWRASRNKFPTRSCHCDTSGVAPFGTRLSGEQRKSKHSHGQYGDGPTIPGLLLVAEISHRLGRPHQSHYMAGKATVCTTVWGRPHNSRVAAAGNKGEMYDTLVTNGEFPHHWLGPR